MKQILLKIYRSLPVLIKRPLQNVKKSYPAQWIAWKYFGYPNPQWYINERQLQPHYKEALRYLGEKYGTNEIGDYLEFGVCRGSSMLLMYQALLETDHDQVRLFGFDSFEGLPADDEGIWTKGSFLGEIDDVLERFSDNNVNLDRVTLVKGFYSETLNKALINKHKINKVGVIMIDCDMYSSTHEALAFCEPLIKDEVIIIFDDWNPLAKDNKGEKRAFDEFLKTHLHFTAVEIGNYHYRPGDYHGKVFKVCRSTSF